MSRPTRFGFRRTTQALAVLVTAAVALTGCGFKGAESLPLPGGKGGGGYKVTIEFSDVLDLVPQSAVKTDDVTVGRVESVELSGYTAKVVALVDRKVKLPANSTVSLRQTSLLGEKFVSIEPPTAEPPRGQLQEGDIIGLDRTTRNVEIEEVLGALSLVLNGGGLEQLQTINRELAKALGGRESEIKDLLKQLNTLIGGLDDQKGQIVRALDALDRLTQRFADNRETLAVALRDIPGGVRELNAQRTELVNLLQSLDKLSVVSTRVIRASQKNTVENLRLLEPILTQLNAAGTAFPRSLELLLTYPFPRTVVDAVHGDFTNLYVTLQLRPPPSSPPTLPRLPGGQVCVPRGDVCVDPNDPTKVLRDLEGAVKNPPVKVPGTRSAPRTPKADPALPGVLPADPISGNWHDMLLGGVA